MTLNDKFIKAIIKLDPISFVGVAKLLGVKLIDQTDDGLMARDFSVVFPDVMEKFNAASRKRKREIISLVENAGVSVNADNS